MNRPDVARQGRLPGPFLRQGPAPAGSDWRRGMALALAIAALLAGVVHPLRRYVVEPRRQALLGRHESPARRLAMASQFGFDTAAGAGIRLVPGRPALELADLPGQAITLILGGFRGPYVVWLWVRAEEEKQRKIHFDLLDRYAKIAALQADYPQVWTYNVWNIVWNETVQWQSRERKYEWIRRGIEFLTEGCRKNPHSAVILESMGWIYSQKLGLSQEAPFYRQRVREDEGRSTFLVAYEWYDRMRKANDRYGTLRGGGLGEPVAYSQACHSLSYYSQELTQEAYDALKAALDARDASGEAQARKAFQDGFRKLSDAIAAWTWARREWRDHILRFEKRGATSEMLSIYRRFFDEADGMVRGLEAVRSGLTYENLPERFKDLRRPEIK
jgi:hypothetical protein